MSADIEPGTCSSCGGRAERGPSGGWWHTEASCSANPQTDGIPSGPVQFQPARQQQDAPRNRMITNPRRDR